ncbi:MAG TPA: hypothetical protein VMT88_07000 [Actinomycetes bacterium]|nr:hypothetical protein [Actinomycetes bacterium]
MQRDDDGAAMIEFLVLAVTLVVPLVYILLAAFDVQRAAFATNSATREAARVFVLAPSTAEAEQRAHDAAQVALADHGLTLADGELAITCSASPCLTPGGRVRVSFSTEVELPLIPGISSGLVAIPISATHTQTVDVYSDLRP